jgi:hypothetical protein
VPIRPIERAEYPGQMLTMDVIGPIDPPANGFKYCLNVIYLHTRWPWSFGLRNLTAKAVCEALCEIFSQVGVCSVITSDCGTNFTAALTKEFLARMGCTPIFNSPGHPEASGLVERYNQTFKNMLHHAIRENPRQWHKCIPS